MDAKSNKFLEIISSPVVIWFILGLVLLFFAVVSIMLLYHWKKYGLKSEHIARAQFIYFPIAVILIGTSILSIIMYSTL